MYELVYTRKVLPDQNKCDLMPRQSPCGNVSVRSFCSQWPNQEVATAHGPVTLNTVRDEI